MLNIITEVKMKVSKDIILLIKQTLTKCDEQQRDSRLS